MGKKTNRKHKDRLFVFMFGNEKFKEFTLSLYNAINNSSYEDKEMITFNILDDYLYMGVKNDVSFIIADTINVYEHQSTLSDNLPYRILLYAMKLYEPIVESAGNSIYQEKIVRLPKPRLIVFYNGSKEIEDERDLYLSDMFDGDKEIEAHVKMLNINYGHNRHLLESCRPLMEYSTFIYRIRQNLDDGMDTFDAISDIIINLENDFIIKSFITSHRMEVTGMLFSAEGDRRQTELYYKNLEDDLKERVTKEVTERVTKEVTETVRKEITEKITEEVKKDVTERVTKEVTEKTISDLYTSLVQGGIDKDIVINSIMSSMKMDKEEVMRIIGNGE